MFEGPNRNSAPSHNPISRPPHSSTHGSDHVREQKSSASFDAELWDFYEQAAYQP
jgi:hypothetical protein